MTIIKEFGNYHLEYHLIVIPMNDAAGQYISAPVVLDRAGKFLTINAVPSEILNNDNFRAIGMYSIRNAIGPAQFAYGQTVEQIEAKAVKEAGTSGAFNLLIHCTIWIDDTKDT